MLEGKVMKLKSQSGREIYITILEANRYQTPRGEKVFVKYYQEDFDFKFASVYEDSLEYVQSNFYEVDELPPRR